MIFYYTIGASMPAIAEQETENWVRAVAKQHFKTLGDIACIFVNDDKCDEFNKQDFNHDSHIHTFDDSDDDTVCR